MTPERLAFIVLGPTLIVLAILVIALVVGVVCDPGGREGDNWEPGQVAALVEQTGQHRVIAARAYEEIAPEVNHRPTHALDRLPDYLRGQLAEMNPVKRAHELAWLLDTFQLKGALS